ncbi:exonuclease domain-containing protein [Thalassotalea atypica]|uniref:exonuclease domain-containing protein n=1 Tax=Thalassotalea atypica TaxID=2054316 RepID=UPI002574677F|nr:exonuclease domain-containing protein [Thalassotalea atypica]
MLNSLFGLNAKRKRQLKKAPSGPIREFLSVPFPEPNTPIDQVPILALDFETTGLDPIDDQLLSIGYVDLLNHRIKLSTAEHFIIKCQLRLAAENVVIHQITEQEKLCGVELKFAIEKLLNALAGKVMLAHFAKIEISFLAQACKQLYGFVPVFPVIDTLAIAKRRLDMRQADYHPSELRLTNLRENYGLPAHYAHNALNDAIATAELLLVDLATHNNANSLLRDILR